MKMHAYALRVPEDIWEQVKAAARLNRRSVNQEIVWRLSERDERARDVSLEGSSPRAGTGVAGVNEGELTTPDPNRASRSESFRPDFKGER
jgi:hypothetical protein